jgi:hypothetical protein
MVIHVARIGEMRKAYKSMAGKTEEKRPLGRPRRRWENNNKLDYTEIGWEGVD